MFELLLCAITSFSFSSRGPIRSGGPCVYSSIAQGHGLNYIMKGWKAIVWRKMGVLIFSVPDPTSHIRLRFLSSRRHPQLCSQALQCEVKVLIYKSWTLRPTDYGRTRAILQILYVHYHIWDIIVFGLNIKGVFLADKTTELWRSWT